MDLGSFCAFACALLCGVLCLSIEKGIRDIYLFCGQSGNRGCKYSCFAMFHYHCIVAKFSMQVLLLCVVGALFVEERKKEIIGRQKIKGKAVGLFSKLLVIHNYSVLGVRSTKYNFQV